MADALNTTDFTKAAQAIYDQGFADGKKYAEDEIERLRRQLWEPVQFFTYKGGKPAGYLLRKRDDYEEAIRLFIDSLIPKLSTIRVSDRIWLIPESYREPVAPIEEVSERA